MFVLLHIIWDALTIRGPGSFAFFGRRLPYVWLLERFLLWWPILFAAAYAGLCLPRPTRWATRWAVLLCYVLLLILCILPSYMPPSDDPGCGVRRVQLACLPDVWFQLFLRFAPIPAMFFLFSGTARRWSLSRAAGLGLMFFSLWRSLYVNVPDLLVIAGGGGVAPAVPAVQWYYDFLISYFWHLVYPLIGLLLFFHRIPLLHGPVRWGSNLRTMLLPFGAWIRRSFGVDLAWGCALLLLDLGAAIGISLLLEQAGTSSVGDDSAVFTRILLDQVFLLSIVAGVGEELVYRGILQGTLQRLFGPRAWGSIAAIVIQALAFGAVHAGYQDLDHLLLPLLFGLFAGVVYRFFGIVATILIHIEIDILAFSSSYFGAEIDTSTDYALATFLFLLLVANLVYPVVRLVIWAVQSMGSHRGPSASP